MVDRAEKIIRLLGERYGRALAYSGTEETPFRVLIGTILSQRTRDGNTAKAAAQLFGKYDTPEKLAGAPVKEVEQLIRPCGFYRTKARTIKKTANVNELKSIH